MFMDMWFYVFQLFKKIYDLLMLFVGRLIIHGLRFRHLIAVKDDI